MSGLAVAALAFAAVWLASLTVVAILVVRQIGLITIRLDRARAEGAPVLDGLAVGTPLPAVADASLPPDTGGPRYLLILAAVCGPCRELADGMHRFPLAGRATAVISGFDDLAAELATRVPDGVRVVTDPVAAAVADALAVSTTPFVFEVREGRVGAKAVLRGPEHLEAFLERSRGSYPLEVIAHAS
jgi:hypothetical protein